MAPAAAARPLKGRAAGSCCTGQKGSGFHTNAALLLFVRLSVMQLTGPQSSSVQALFCHRSAVER